MNYSIYSYCSDDSINHDGERRDQVRERVPLAPAAVGQAQLRQAQAYAAVKLRQTLLSLSNYYRVKSLPNH